MGIPGVGCILVDCATTTGVPIGRRCILVDVLTTAAVSTGLSVRSDRRFDPKTALQHPVVRADRRYDPRSPIPGR